MNAAALALDPRVEAYLHARHGSRAADVAIRVLSGDASTRRYFRLHGPTGASVLALYPEAFEAASMPFLVTRDLLEGYGLPVPRVLDHDGPRGIVLLEDLGDVTLQEALSGASEVRRGELYRGAVHDLETLQRESARQPRAAACFQIGFDLQKLCWELHYFLKHFVEGLRGRSLTVEDRVTLAESFHGLSAEIASWPRALCHRDFHSRNLMLHGERLVWIDFQDARMGPASYDLVSLLRDSYAELPEELVREEKQRFREAACPGEPRDVFGRRFDLVSVQRSLKALGTFGYMTSARGSDVYLPHIPRALAHARRALAGYPELAELRRVLARYIEELS